MDVTIFHPRYKTDDEFLAKVKELCTAPPALSVEVNCCCRPGRRHDARPLSAEQYEQMHYASFGPGAAAAKAQDVRLPGGIPYFVSIDLAKNKNAVRYAGRSSDATGVPADSAAMKVEEKLRKPLQGLIERFVSRYKESKDVVCYAWRKAVEHKFEIKVNVYWASTTIYGCRNTEQIMISEYWPVLSNRATNGWVGGSLTLMVKLQLSLELLNQIAAACRSIDPGAPMALAQMLVDGGQISLHGAHGQPIDGATDTAPVWAPRTEVTNGSKPHSQAVRIAKRSASKQTREDRTQANA